MKKLILMLMLSVVATAASGKGVQRLSSPDGKLVVEDVKSEMTRHLPDYVMKRKLMLYVHGIKLKEVI